MNRIPLQDERYEMIKNIAPKKYYRNETFVWFPNSNFFIVVIEKNEIIKFILFKGYMSRETYLPEWTNRSPRFAEGDSIESFFIATQVW